MISEVALLIIKELIAQGSYRMIYDEDDNEAAGWKTREYIVRLGMPEDLVVQEVTKTLKAERCTTDIDDNPKYEQSKPGTIYKFKTDFHGERLYVKYKLLEDPDFIILVFSIHPAEY